jgi:uncharacterized protein
VHGVAFNRLTMRTDPGTRPERKHTRWPLTLTIFHSASFRLLQLSYPDQAILRQVVMREKNNIRCPICGKETTWNDNPFRPFCSDRCRVIDLGKWASENYRITDDKDKKEGGEGGIKEN